MKLVCCLVLLSLIYFSSSFPTQRFLQGNETSGNSTNSNTTNTSNTSNTSTSSDTFINIVANNPVSQLSSSQFSTLDFWLNWKNKWPRYDSKFDPVPKYFAPQEDYYKNSILALGTVFFLIGGVIIFIGLLFVAFRYSKGRSGNKGEGSELLLSVSRVKRHCSIITAIVALLLWFSGMVVALVGTMEYHNNLLATTDSLSAMGNIQRNQAQTFLDISNNINKLNLTYPNDTTQNFTLDFYSFPDIYAAAESIDNGAEDFITYLKSDDNVFQGFLWVFFLFGLASLAVMVFSMLKKMGNFTSSLGICYILFSAMAFGLAGFFFSQCFKIGDICEQNSNIINKNYPDSGKGVFYYVPCFGSKSVKKIIQVNNDGMSHLMLAIDFYFSYLNASSYNDYYLKIQHQTDIIALYDNKTFEQNANIMLWGGIIKDLSEALYGLENIKNCVGPRQYSVESQANLCVNGLPGLYLGFVGILIQAIAFFLLIFTGIQLKSVLEKLKSDSQSVIQMRQANYS